MYKQKYADRAAKALFATVLTAGLMFPSASALAKTSATDVDDASFTVTGIKQGDVVHAYQIFDTDIDSNNNLTFEAKVTGLPDAYNTVDKISAIATDSEDSRALADAIAAKVIETSSKKAEDATAEANGKATLTLDSGYWLVTVTSNSGETTVYQTMLVDATPDIAGGKYVTRTIADASAKKQPVTPPSKKIVDASGNAGQSTDTYSVGDTAKFVIEGTVPNYPADATRAVYSITDVPDAGLNVKTDTFVVKAGTETLVKDTHYTLTANSDGTYTVAFTMDYILKHPGQKVTINYDAEITRIDLETGKIGNKVYGTFTPNPYENKDVDTEKKDPWDQTYGFFFKKYGGTDTDKSPLAGAEFTVTDKDNKPVTYIDANGTLHTDGKVTSDSNGYVYVNGLKNGTYTVTETGVPSGFQKIEPFTVTLNEGTAKGDADSTDGVIEVNFNNAGEKIDPRVGQLPETGGAGTIALTAGGILLIVGGSVVAYRSFRREEE